MGGIRRAAPPRTRRAPSPPSHAKTASRAERSQSPIPWSFYHNPNDTPSSPRKARDAPKALTRSREPPQARISHFKPSISRRCEYATSRISHLPPTRGRHPLVVPPAPCRCSHARPPSVPPLPRARHAIRRRAATPSDALADGPLLAQNQRPDAFLPFAA